uniref:Peptidase C26 n=1 Tax=Solibacter usitatus (strain Ellin6076) TaxID=234267 RepID=Q01Y57_SOLUE
MIRVALPFGSTPESKRSPYRQALALAGIQPVENATTLTGLDGLVLAGGSDIDPAIYGAECDPLTGKVDCDRDRVELALVREALDRDLPVLAICRGMQLLNVALGGTLKQHIEGHRSPGQRDAHSVAIEANSELRSILGMDEFVVNSRHHQCLGRVASGLVVVATAVDNVIEAVELPEKRFVIGVQWHPEDRVDGEDGKLFAAFRHAIKRSSH